MDAYHINNYLMYWWQELMLCLYMNGISMALAIATSKHMNEFSHCLII